MNLNQLITRCDYGYFLWLLFPLSVTPTVLWCIDDFARLFWILKSINDSYKVCTKSRFILSNSFSFATGKLASEVSISQLTSKMIIRARINSTTPQNQRISDLILPRLRSRIKRLNHMLFLLRRMIRFLQIQSPAASTFWSQLPIRRLLSLFPRINRSFKSFLPYPSTRYLSIYRRHFPFNICTWSILFLYLWFKLFHLILIICITLFEECLVHSGFLLRFWGFVVYLSYMLKLFLHYLSFLRIISKKRSGWFFFAALSHWT